MTEMQTNKQKAMPKQKFLCNLNNIFSKFQSYCSLLLWFSTGIDIIDVIKMFWLAHLINHELWSMNHILGTIHLLVFPIMRPGHARNKWKIIVIRSFKNCFRLFNEQFNMIGNYLKSEKCWKALDSCSSIKHWWNALKTFPLYWNTMTMNM